MVSELLTIIILVFTFIIVFAKFTITTKCMFQRLPEMQVNRTNQSGKVTYDICKIRDTSHCYSNIDGYLLLLFDF